MGRFGRIIAGRKTKTQAIATAIGKAKAFETNTSTVLPTVMWSCRKAREASPLSMLRLQHPDESPRPAADCAAICEHARYLISPSTTDPCAKGATVFERNAARAFVSHA